ncbi:MAG: ribosome biogenesis GTPase Der [Bacteroidales bacterium]|nr:ribosome biogenesis GTPase Der [Bacteroidales bacterium]
MSEIVAIIGRPNVGKSTFFNRMTESRTAIVDEISGVTRDRIYGKVEWNGKEFSIIDTGGFVVGSDDVFEEQIRKQASVAIEEANIILFMVDAIEGITPLDEELADILRRAKKKIFVVANKVDSPDKISLASVFYRFGLGEVYTVSSVNGSGSGELLDEIVKNIDVKSTEEKEEIPRIAIVGRPNVGKSSLLNALIGEERNIVTPIPGTTRDSILTKYNKFGYNFFLVDTAGIRKKNKVTENLEFYSVMRAIRAIENSDVILLLIDATVGWESQDMNILSLAISNSKGVVLLVNKWDLAEKNYKTHGEVEEFLKKKLAPFSDVPILFISALTKQRINKALEVAIKVYENRKRHISTSKLNNVLLPLIEKCSPPTVKGKQVRIKYITQLPTHSPAFAFFCNLPQYVREPYKRYLENQIREKFEFSGVPIKIFLRKK